MEHIAVQDDAQVEPVPEVEQPGSAPPGPLPLPHAVRRSLQVGACDDPHEHEAERVADDVVAALGQPLAALRRLPSTEEPAGPLARVGAAGGEAPDLVDRLVAGAASTGRELSGQVRRSFEEAMGADLSHVRVHTGSDVDAGSRSIGARAFTVGRDVFFRDGVPDTSTPDGQRVVAHELAHTLQRSPSVQPIRRLKDGTPADADVDEARIKAETSLEVLAAWKAKASWDEDDLVTLIDARVTELKERKAAEAKAAAATKRKDEVQATVTTAITNYDAAVDADLKGLLANAKMKDAERSAWFFLAAAASESARTPAQVLALLKSDEVALEAFIYGNGAPGGVAATTAAQALAVSAAWAGLAKITATIGALDGICAEVTAGRIKAQYKEYRKAKVTSTNGGKFIFSRLDPNRALAPVQFHVHLGRAVDLNNAGFKVGKDGPRQAVSGGQYAQVKKALDAVKAWPAE